MATPSTPPAHVTTEFESLLYQAGFTEQAEREQISDIAKSATIGISSMASVSSWEFSALTVASNFPTSMASLVSKMQALDATLLGTAEKQNTFTCAVRMALSAEEQAHQNKLKTLGLASNTTTQFVIGGEHGDLLTSKAELESLISFDASAGGFTLPVESMPTYKMISHFMRSLKCNPPALWWYPLERATCAYELQLREKPLQSTAEALTKKPTPYDDISEISLTKQIVVMKQIKLVMQALAIAGSYVIPGSEINKYTGPTVHNRIMYNGAETVVYATRLIVETVQAWMYRYAENLSPQELINAMQETVRMASTYISQGYLVNAAIVLSLHDAREDWKSGRRGGPRRDPRDRDLGGPSGGGVC